MRELVRDAWRLPPLAARDMGPYGDFPRLSDAEKQDLWRAYRAGTHSRVPVKLGINNRVVLQSPELNPDGLSYRSVFRDAEAMLLAELRTQYLIRARFAIFQDADTSMPEEWHVSVHRQNVSEAAFFGCPLEFREGEVPDTTPIYGGHRKRAVFDVGIDHPAEKGFFAEGLRMTCEMSELALRSTFFGRPIVVDPYLPPPPDGPLTVAMNIRGPEILTDLVDDATYAAELFEFIVAAAIRRVKAFRAYWGMDEGAGAEVALADDSIALLGTEQYRQWILPWHRKWYESQDPDHSRKRSIHLCGDAQRHFAAIHRELGVISFDTGFPVDFARIRQELGLDAEVLGGVEVATLLAGSPQAVYDRASAILSSGILRGGRFLLREGNNLPPGTPWQNLAAMYCAAFRFGLTRPRGAG